MRRLLAVGIPLAIACGCSTDPRTEIVVVVGSDLDVPDDMEEIRVTAVSPDAQVGEATARLGADEPPLPRTVGLVYPGGPLGPVSVRVAGRKGGTVVMERRARVTFQRERTLALRLDLLAECVGESCSGDRTCAQGGCRPIDVAPGELEEWGGSPAEADGGG